MPDLAVPGKMQSRFPRPALASALAVFLMLCGMRISALPFVAAQGSTSATALYSRAGRAIPAGPVTVTGLTLSVSAAVGGSVNPVTASVTFNNASMAVVDASVQFSSDNGAASVNANANGPVLHLAPGATTLMYSVLTAGVDADTTVHLTATVQGSSQSAVLTVQAASLSGFGVATLGNLNTEVITLNGAAGPSGAAIQLVSDYPRNIAVPTNILIPAGSSFGALHETYYATQSPSSSTVTASYKGGSVSVLLNTVPLLNYFTVVSAALNGGATLHGYVAFGGPNAVAQFLAPPGGATVNVTGDNAAITPFSVGIPAGQRGANFDVPTRSVNVNTLVTLTASYGNVQNSVVVTLKPIPLFDFNGDGNPDLLLQQQSTCGVSVVTLSGVAQVGFAVIFPNLPVGRQVVGSPDLNKDGSTDLIFQDTATGAVSYVLLDRLTALSNPNSADGLFDGYLFPTVPAGFHVVGTPDLNGDGYPDILFENPSTGDIAYVLMRALTSGQSGYLLRGLDTSYHLAGTLDLNNDGHPDLIFQSRTTGGVVYQLMNGLTPIANGFGVLFDTVLPGFVLVGTPDLNADGHQDLVFQNSATGDVSYVLLNGTTVLSYGYILRGLSADYKVVGIH